MNEKKSRILMLLLGVSIGLLIGVVFYFSIGKQDQQKNDISESVVAQIVQKVSDLLSLNKNSKDSTNNQSKNNTVFQSNTVEKIMDSVQINSDKDSLNLSSIATSTDSLFTDSIATKQNPTTENSDDIVIKKDEFIVSKLVEVVYLNSSIKNTNKTDSIAQLVSGIKENPESKGTYNVEYWKSPINYKGYKLLKNKLILFGLDQEAPIKLVYNEGNAYLKYIDAYYRLDNYNDFKAFDKVTNLQLLSILPK